MSTSTVKYVGQLRAESVHLASNNKIITDAPKDNFGKGEAFSPTDLTATSLAQCILTTIGIKAGQEGLRDIDGATADVTKVMYSDPRRIGEIHIKIAFPKKDYSEKERKMYENIAHTCPVARSLHPDIKQQIEFHW